jgi:hypothetical protein
MSLITSGDPRPARGRKRQAELAAEMKKAVEINSAIMLNSLGRPYSIGEAFIAEAICSMYLRARRLRDAGRDDLPVLTEVARLQQGSAFAQPVHAPRPLPTINPAEEAPGSTAASG